MNSRDILRTLVTSSTSTPCENTFMNEFLEQLAQYQYHDKQVHNLQEMNYFEQNNIFEEFSKFYLQKKLNISNVWLLKEIPEEILEHLNLKRQDVGIDIVGLDNEGKFYACRAKYKDRSINTKYKTKIPVTRKEVSTFFSLVARTGPYKKYIIITTADYVRHMAPKSPKDVSICIGTLRKLKPEDFVEFSGAGYLRRRKEEIREEETSDSPISDRSIIEQQNKEFEEALKADKLRELDNIQIPPSPRESCSDVFSPPREEAPKKKETHRNETPQFIRDARIAYFEKKSKLSLV